MTRSRTRIAASATAALSAGMLVAGLIAGAASPAAAATPYAVLVIEDSGGFMPPSWAMRRTPRVAIYSDGTIYATSQAQTLQYPGPAAPGIRRKAGASIMRILAAAEAAKVTDPTFDWGLPGIADAPSTVFKIQRSARGPVVRVDIYALGIDGFGLTKEQTAARTLAAALADRLQSFDNQLVPTKSMPTTWTSTRWAYSAEPMARDGFSVVRPWISKKALSTTPMCNELTVAENRAIVALLPKLNQASRWTSDKRLWNVNLRPLFPHESGCGSLEYASGW